MFTTSSVVDEYAGSSVSDGGVRVEGGGVVVIVDASKYKTHPANA